MNRKNYTEIPLISYDDLIKGGKYKAFAQIEKGNVIDESEDEIFDKKYDIKIYRYHYTGEEPYWDKLQVHVMNKETNSLIAEINTNYHDFHGVFIQQNEQDFLIIPANYQGYTIINLTTKVVKAYMDLDDYNHGCGFCTYDYVWDMYDNKLYAYGCVWACPEEVMEAIIPDLNNPIEGLNSAKYEINYSLYYEDEEDDDDE